MYACGNGGCGSLGNASGDDSGTFVPIVSLTGKHVVDVATVSWAHARALAAALTHTCAQCPTGRTVYARSALGTCYCWGRGASLLQCVTADQNEYDLADDANVGEDDASDLSDVESDRVAPVDDWGRDEGSQGKAGQGRNRGDSGPDPEVDWAEEDTTVIVPLRVPRLKGHRVASVAAAPHHALASTDQGDWGSKGGTHARTRTRTHAHAHTHAHTRARTRAQVSFSLGDAAPSASWGCRAWRRR